MLMIRPANTPKELMPRNGEVADTMKAMAVVSDVQSIANDARL
jgi:hypothetical protein